MSARYVTINEQPAAAWWGAKVTDFLARTIHEREPAKIDTGLLNSAGVKLNRVEDANPIGFIHPKG